MRVCELPLQSV